MSHFNGSYGCLLCTHQCEVAESGRGHSRIYPMSDKLPSRRTDDSFRENAENAEAGADAEHARGAKLVTVLFHLAYLLFPLNFVVDHIHAVCVGFVRSTARLWFGHRRSTCRYQIGDKTDEVDRRLLNITAVWEITRLPRSVREWKYWKASEWRNWLFFYSPVILEGLLSNRHFQNWAKFVCIMHVLHGKTVAMDVLHSVQKEMVSFLSVGEKCGEVQRSILAAPCGQRHGMRTTLGNLIFLL